MNNIKEIVEEIELYNSSFNHNGKFYFTFKDKFFNVGKGVFRSKSAAMSAVNSHFIGTFQQICIFEKQARNQDLSTQEKHIIEVLDKKYKNDFYYLRNKIGSVNYDFNAYDNVNWNQYYAVRKNNDEIVKKFVKELIQSGSLELKTL